MSSIIIDNIRLPDNIEQGAKGGPTFKTDVLTTSGGYETTNQKWSLPRQVWDIGYGVSNKADLKAVIDFFHGRRGRARGFRFKNWLNYKVTGQSIATADGSTTTFQLKRTIADTVHPLDIDVTLPVSGTVKIYENGTDTNGAGWTVDTTTGVVTYAVAPANGVVITADFEYDIPVRFASDKLDIDMEWECAISIPSIPIVEVRV